MLFGSMHCLLLWANVMAPLEREADNELENQEVLHMNVVDVLGFIFQLGSLELGQVR